MRWAEITVESPPESVDAVSYAMIDAGCGGVVIEGANPVSIKGSLPVSDELTGRLDSLRSHLDRFPEFGLPPILDSLTIRYAEDADWANAWRQYFKPLRVGRSLIVKPSWEPYVAENGELILELDPGMAFGTGGHPTTQLCLKALEVRVQPGMRVADIGTGSGILAIATARLGASEVLATDIDSLPRRIARENVERNGLSDVISVLDMEPFDQTAYDRDLIVANIVANTIIEIAPTVAPRLRQGGIFIASGIVEEHHDLVRDALEALGLQHLETLRDDIWVCLVSAKLGTPDPDSESIQRASEALPSLMAQ